MLSVRAMSSAKIFHRVQQSLTEVIRCLPGAAVSSGRDQSNPLGSMFSDPQMFQKLAANPKTAPLLADQAFMAQVRLFQLKFA